MFGIFTRSRLYQNLSPAERAFLRTLELVVLGALVSGYQAASPLLARPDLSTVDWTSVLHTFLAAVVVALASGALKYGKAFGDPPLPNAPSDAAVPPALVMAPAGSAIPQTLAELASLLAPALATPSVNEPAGGGAEPVSDAAPPEPLAACA